MDYFNDNKLLWNEKTKHHLNSEFYDLAGFKAGRDSLNPVEIALLGDVKEKSILHLQCHFGQDTLSLARKGAKATGVDLSDTAILHAKQLNTELNLAAEFICSNVYDLNEKAGSFDIVFTSYGTIGWLPDLDKWAEVIRRHLKPGGTFIMVDFHPVVWMFDDDFTHIKYPYHNHGVITETNKGTYADRNAPIRQISHGWNHSISEIINALVSHSLNINSFDEYNYSPYNCFNGLIETAPGKFKIERFEDKIPMVYAIKATRK
ncbi:MAG: class I SAM-dependent methyltransferase [Bacteroidia bacterium]|nr:class I SAM-dependent methyltransferase [Bacteroidia bacterium]